MRTKTWIQKNIGTLIGKTVAISGATGGLGRELCRHISSLGANLILLDRNIKKSKALADELREVYPELSVSHICVDLEDISAVKAAANALMQTKVDFLILNAGAYSIPRKKCDTGYDNVFQINFVSPYFLARTLYPHIAKNGGKIVAVGSIAHNYSKSDPEDIDFSKRKKASLVYGNAKRYLMFSLPKIDEAKKTVSIAHPGITFTNITAHYPKLIFLLIKHPMKVIFMSPKRASLSILKGMLEDCGSEEWIGPRIFNVWGLPKKKSLTSADQDEIRRICEIADRIYSELNESF